MILLLYNITNEKNFKCCKNSKKPLILMILDYGSKRIQTKVNKRMSHIGRTKRHQDKELELLVVPSRQWGIGNGYFS